MIIVEVLGHLGNDPETRFTPSGQKVTNFRMAANTRRGGVEQTHWVTVTVWGDNNIVQYLKKGSAVIVVGELTKADTYTDRNGNTKPSLDVTAEMLRFPPFGKDRDAQGQQGQQQPQQQQAPASGYSEPQPQAPQYQQPEMAGHAPMEEEEPLPF